MVARVEKVIDEEKKMDHTEIAEEIEKLITSGKVRIVTQSVLFVYFDANFASQLTKETIDRCYVPVIQSGGSYDLAPNATSSAGVLKFDTIICSLGIRYRNYCSNIARTLMINPTPAQKKVIGFLSELQKHCLSLLKPGSIISEVYDSVIEFITEKQPELVSHFVKTLGFGVCAVQT